MKHSVAAVTGVPLETRTGSPTRPGRHRVFQPGFMGKEGEDVSSGHCVKDDAYHLKDRAAYLLGYEEDRARPPLPHRPENQPHASLPKI